MLLDAPVLPTLCSKDVLLPKTAVLEEQSSEPHADHADHGHRSRAYFQLWTLVCGFSWLHFFSFSELIQILPPISASHTNTTRPRRGSARVRAGRTVDLWSGGADAGALAPGRVLPVVSRTQVW